MKPFLALSLLLGLLSGCRSDGEKRVEGTETRTEKNSALMDEMKGAPDWVRKDCRTWLKKPEVLCAVGSAQGIEDVSLLRDTAMARARGQLAEAVSVSVRKIIQDFRDQTRSDGSAVADSHVQAITENATKSVLQGSMMEESWISPRGTFYVMVSCPKEQVVGGLGGLSQIPAEMRTFVVDKARAAFDALEAKLGDK